MPSAEMEVARRRVPVSSQTYRCKRKGSRCQALEPVLEHYESPSEKPSSPSHVAGGGQAGKNDKSDSKKGKAGMRILSKLRDGYVKLMNEVASGADYSGASSFYGCPVGADSAAFHARVQREQREKQVMMHALQLQLAHSRQLHPPAPLHNFTGW